MKNVLLTTLMAGLVLSSCVKNESLVEQSQVRTFSYEMVGRSMYTKSVETDAVLDVINGALPESVSLFFTSQTTNKTYRGQTNEPIVLASDIYKVEGVYYGTAKSGALRTSMDYVSHEPSIKVNTNVEVTDDVTQYTLQATYDCFAIIFDADEVDKVYISTTSCKETELQLIASGNLKVAFIQGDYSNYIINLRITPKDTERFIETTYALMGKQANDCVNVQNGKFYVFRPKAEGNEPKVVGLDLPTFARIDVPNY